MYRGYRYYHQEFSSNRVATLGTPDGTFSYAYDGNGNLDEVTRPDTKTTAYHYENGTYLNALTGITDAASIRFSSYGYNGSGKAVLSEHAGGADEYNVSYNGAESTTTNPLGKDSTYVFTNILGVRQAVQENLSASPNSPAASRYFNYDQKGRVIGITDWEGITTRYSYDDRGNITQLTEATGTAEQRIKTITYNNDFNLPELITAPGKTTDYDYDTYGRMTSMSVTDTATSETRITAYTYHANTTDGGGNLVLGRLATVDGPRTDVSDVTSYTYDGNLNLTKITNALSQETNITARDAAGRPTTIEDANGVETVLVYNSNGWLTSSTVASGTPLAAQTTYAYDANGNLTQVTLPNAVTVEYSYDNAQRLTGVEDTMGNTITYTLDANGNITKEDIKDNSATLKYTHTQVFDELSRIIESVGASAQDTDYVYDKNSNMTRMTDANNNATNYAYDSLIRFTSSTDALSGNTNLTYNPLNDVTDVKDQRNNTTTYTYNAFGDVTGEVSPDRGTIAYVVDKTGNVTQRTDARGVVTDYAWDALNRLTSIAYPPLRHIFPSRVAIIICLGTIHFLMEPVGGIRQV